MNPTTYRLAEVSGKISAVSFFPVGILTGYLCTRSYEVDGISFLLIDPLTVGGTIAALFLALLSLFWWEECGHGWPDLLKLGVKLSPLGVLLLRLDPTASGPTRF